MVIEATICRTLAADTAEVSASEIDAVRCPSYELRIALLSNCFPTYLMKGMRHLHQDAQSFVLVPPLRSHSIK